MAKRVKSQPLGSREARKGLPTRDKPYYVSIDRGVHLGYRKGKRGGRWVVRVYAEGDYTVKTFAQADDVRDADGVAVLDFWQAQARAREMATEDQRIAAGIETPSGPYTVRQCMTDYLEHLHEHGKTAQDAQIRVDALVLPDLGDIECAKLTAKRLRQWHRALARKPARLRTRKGKDQKYRELDPDDAEAVRRRRATANRTLTILKGALNRAWREGDIPSDDAWRRIKPFPNVDMARARYLTVQEAQRLINACDPDLRNLVHGALTTGARYGELAALDARDYDPNTGQVHVRQSKSGNGRHIVLNDEGQTLFDQLTAGRAGDAPIFKRATGSRWLRSHQSRPFAEACRRAKIEPPISFHGLRHTYASLSIMNGAPPMVVAENLGHSDTRMVEKHYGHLARKFVADTIRKTAPTFGSIEDQKVRAI